MQLNNKQRGIVLSEMVIYVALVALIVGLVVQLLVVMSQSYLDFRIKRNLVYGGQVMMERLVREIRQANNIDDSGSVFATHPGSLKLNTVDSGGAVNTVEFYASSTALYIKEGSAAGVSLTPQHLELTNLVFRKITTTESKAVKIELTLEDDRGQVPRSLKLYSTAILRNSY